MRCKQCNASVMRLIAVDVYWCPECGSMCFRYAFDVDEWTEPRYRAKLKRILALPDTIETRP